MVINSKSGAVGCGHACWNCVIFSSSCSSYCHSSCYSCIVGCLMQTGFPWSGHTLLQLSLQQSAVTVHETMCSVLLHEIQSIVSPYIHPTPEISRARHGMASGPGHGGSISSSDLGYGGSSTYSDLGYGGSSAAVASTHSTSHLVECYQKMTVQPHDEGEL